MDSFFRIAGPDYIQACGGKKNLVRILLCALTLTALHYMYIVRNEILCGTGEKCALGKLTFALPPISTSYGSSELKPRYHFKSYDEYIQLQLKKTLNPKLRKLWSSRDWRRKVDVFSFFFQDLMKNNVLKTSDKTLCIGARVGQEVLALKEIGVQDAVGIDLVPSLPLVVKGDIHKHPFDNNSFDFEFSNVFDHSLFPALFASEIERTLKPGGHAVIHVSLKRRGDKYSANDLYSVDPLISLFKRCDVVHVREVDGFGLDTEVVFQKRLKNRHKGEGGKTQALSGNCPVSRLQQRVIEDAEPLITEEPEEPWTTLKQNLMNIKYLPSVTNIANHRRYVYVDVGAKGYGSSIGRWFEKEYPKQNQRFYIYAVELNTSFAAEYVKQKDASLLPYAAWIRNESLEMEGEMDMGVQSEKQVSLGGVSANLSPGERSREVVGFDFAKWLQQAVSSDDFVVVKMDVEGVEFDLLPRMFETGAICLVDELFLECHYQRISPGSINKLIKSYGDCLALFKAVRNSGVLVHQWLQFPELPTVVASMARKV